MPRALPLSVNPHSVTALCHTLSPDKVSEAQRGAWPALELTAAELGRGSRVWDAPGLVPGNGDESCP